MESMEDLVASSIVGEIDNYILKNKNKSFEEVYDTFFKELDKSKYDYESLSEEKKNEIKNYFYETFNSMKNYYELYAELRGLEFFNRLFSQIETSFQVKKFFDSKGPKKEFYDVAISQGKCDVLNTLVKIFKNKYSDDKAIINYLKFRSDLEYAMADDNIFFRKIKCVDDIYNYFNEFGPKKELYLLALHDKTLLSHLFDLGSYLEKEIPTDKIELTDIQIKYLEFVKSKKIVLPIENKIEDYFNEFGPKDSLYYKALLDEQFFKALFVDGWQEKYKFADESITSYVEFLRENMSYFNCFSKIITNIQLIDVYFDENGLNNTFYETVLLNNEYFYYFVDLLKKYFDIPENVKKYIDFRKKYGNIFHDVLESMDDINRFFNSDGVTDEFKQYLSNNSQYSKRIITHISHNRRILNGDDKGEIVELFRYYLTKTYFSELPLDKRDEKLDYLYSYFKKELLLECESSWMSKLISTDIDELNKIFSLFESKEKNIPYNVLYNNIIISLSQLSFRKEYPELVEGFTNINSLIRSLDEESLRKYFDGNVIVDNIKLLDNYIKDIIKVLNLNEEELETLKVSVIERKNLSEENLRAIYRKYLKEKERLYLEEFTQNFCSNLSIQSVYSKEESIKKLSKYITEKLTYTQYKQYLNNFISFINSKEKKDYFDELNISMDELDILLSITEEEHKLIVDYIVNPRKPDKSLAKKLAKYKHFINLYSIYLVNENYADEQVLTSLDVKREPLVELVDYNFSRIFRNLDIDIFLNTVVKNEDVYKVLKKVLKNFYIGRLPKKFTTFFEKHDIELDGNINDIGLFIQNFYSILVEKQRELRIKGTYVELGDIHLFFKDVIQLISDSNLDTIELRRLLGKDDYKKFARNPGGNASINSRGEREEKLYYIVDYLYTLSKITIPSSDSIIQTNDETKKINIIVGNRTSASNICHGERTDACMRVGGVGEGLFLKCITDPNWFHIRFENPDTHEYISRVSGFRNGNTVYLNQLREVPAGSKYTNEDLQEVIIKFANQLIEYTKNSKFPIENVFINDMYAMESYQIEEDKKHKFGDVIQQEYNLDGLEQLRLKDDDDIWTDVRTSAILLATTEEGVKTPEGYMPLKNGPQNTEVYDCVRDKIYGINTNTDLSLYRYVKVDVNILYEKINRVYSMKQKLLGEEYYDIEDLELENGIIDGYASADWYVYVDSNNEIHYDYIEEIHKNDMTIPYDGSIKAKEEMEHHIDVLKNMYNIGDKLCIK